MMINIYIYIYILLMCFNSVVLRLTGTSATLNFEFGGVLDMYLFDVSVTLLINV